MLICAWSSAACLRRGRQNGCAWAAGRCCIQRSTWCLPSGLAIGGIIPLLLPLPYLVQWLETIWGTLARPAVKQKPVRIGMRQLNCQYVIYRSVYHHLERMTVPPVAGSRWLSQA